jgi:DDE family transposase
LVEPTAPGDPESPLRWSSKSVRTLAIALQALGHQVSHTVVAELLHELGYSLQGNVKTREGRQHPDRDAQFRYIADTVKRSQRREQPTISVDRKKRTDWCLQERRPRVAPHRQPGAGARA